MVSSKKVDWGKENNNLRETRGCLKQLCGKKSWHKKTLEARNKSVPSNTEERAEKTMTISDLTKNYHGEALKS
jgi:hypothetical protein